MALTKKQETMSETNFNEASYQRAKKRVGEIREFYQHLLVFLLVNTLLILFNDQIIAYLQSMLSGSREAGDWAKANVYFTPIFWGIGLCFHGIYTFIFRGSLLRRWEEKQMKKYMDED